MLGVADHQRAVTGISRTAPDQVLLDRFLAPLKGATAAELWEQAHARGAGLTIEAAVSEGS
jgi:hypothetical protein